MNYGKITANLELEKLIRITQATLADEAGLVYPRKSVKLTYDGGIVVSPPGQG